MAMEWKTIAVPASVAEEDGMKGWEPFAAVVQDGEALILGKAYVEVEGERSSTLEGNKNWAGNEPDAEDMDLPETADDD